MLFKKLAVFVRQALVRHVLLGVSAGLICGILLWNVFLISLDRTSTTEFCTTCHSMKTYVYEDYKQSPHFKNTKGIQAGCGDCHIPKPLAAKLVRKTIGLKDIYHTLVGTIDSPEKFSARKQLLVDRVRNRMKSSDSRECRSCHHLEQMDFARQSAIASKLHQESKNMGKTCVDCHQGVGHQAATTASNDQKAEENFSLD